MSTRTTAVNLDSLDRASDAVVLLGSPAFVSGYARKLLYRLGGMLGAFVVTPFVVLALSVLVFMFLLKLITALVATVIER